MSLEQLIRDYPEITYTFLNKSETSLVILTNKDYHILDCNQALASILHLAEKPLGRFLWELFCPLEGDELDLTVSTRNQEVMLPQIFRVCYAHILCRCYVFKIKEGFLLFGDRFESADNEVLQSMSLLNNELSSLTRELSKKNRALELANQRITELMRTDPLTGLANRRYFQERFHDSLALAMRGKCTLTLIMADLDYFKSINDTHGHEAGDRVLYEFARLLQNNSRTEDLPVRFGGEEFVVLMPQSTAAQAWEFGERIRSLLESRNILPDQKVTASIGIAELRPEDTLDSLLKRADQALYQAKKSGRNRLAMR